MAQSFDPDVLRTTVADTLYRMGIIPEPELTDETPYITAFTDYIATAPSQDKANFKSMALIAFMGELARELKWFEGDTTDDRIKACVSTAASRAPLDMADASDVIRATQSCLCYWNRAETPMESIVYCISNLMIPLGVITTVLGVMTEAINDIDRAPDPN